MCNATSRWSNTQKSHQQLQALRPLNSLESSVRKNPFHSSIYTRFPRIPSPVSPSPRRELARARFICDTSSQEGFPSGASVTSQSLACPCFAHWCRSHQSARPIYLLKTRSSPWHPSSNILFYQQRPWKGGMVVAVLDALFQMGKTNDNNNDNDNVSRGY